MDRSDFAAISDEESVIIAEEENLLARVRSALEDAPTRSPDKRTQARMTSLRTELSEAGFDDIATLAAEAQRVRSTAGIRERVQRPDVDLPYFAHMQLESDRGVRDVLLGQCTFINAKRRVTIVDWRAAPVAQIFFNHKEGEEYEQENPDRSVEGVLLKRRMLAFDRGELVQIQTPTNCLRRNADGDWMRDAAGRNPTLEGGQGGSVAQRTIGTGLSGLKLPVVSSLLDEKQYAALTSDAERPLLIVGGAGCGKTTVAIHRLAYLTYQQPEVYTPNSLLVVVPEEGLLRLTKSLLEELGLGAVSVTTVDDWFTEQGRSLFPNLPTKLSVSTPASIIRLKRHPALYAQLEGLANDAGQACAADIDRLLRTGNQFAARYASAEARIPLERLESAFEQTIDERPEVESGDIRTVFDQAMLKFANAQNDRQRLLGDRVLIDEVIRDAHGELSGSLADLCIDRFRLQHALTTEEEYADVASHRRRTIDGLSLDAGTPTEDAGSIDVEDFALLLELHRRKTGRAESTAGTLPSYTHLVLDEAQELSDVELSVLGQTIAKGGSMTVAGDPAQQIGFGPLFRGWDPVMRALGQGRAAPVTLETSYRCTRPIVEFGHAVLGPLAPEQAPSATREGAPVSKSLLSSEMHVAMLLGEALSDLLGRESMAQVAIITREDETAERLYDSLHQQLPVRLVLDGRFSFKPGIDITSVAHVKGLEFDYVVIPDASDVAYPEESASRRMLHVASTRAIHQLWVLSTGSWSRLLP